MLDAVHALLLARAPFAPAEPGPAGAAARAALPWRRLATLVVLGGGLYGAAMGLFGGPGPQALLSALKVPFLIVASTALCLPSLLAVGSVLGLRGDLPSMLRGILAAQATVAVALAALAPLLLLVYASSGRYELAKAASGVAFLAASLAGQRTLARHFAPLVRADPAHRIGRRVWWLCYVLVTIQLAWLLRPFVGHPGMPLELFRAEAWGNAYVEVLRGLGRLLEGG